MESLIEQTAEKDAILNNKNIFYCISRLTNDIDLLHCDFFGLEGLVAEELEFKKSLMLAQAKNIIEAATELKELLEEIVIKKEEEEK